VQKDALQWIIDECYLTENPAQLDPKRVSHRLLLVNDISLHSTAFTVQNVILDLFSQDPSLGFVEALREQCKTVLAEAGGSWTRDAVRKLTLVDSTIRESMRLSPFGTIGLPRTVVHPDGIKLDNTDVTVPQGTVFAVPMEPVHYDEDIYPDARKFNAFRFAQPSAVKNVFDSFTSKEDIEAARLSEANGDPKKPKSSVSLDDAFLGFGFGKYACPGRFFALNEMKIFMAHMLLNYDVEYLKVRPQHMNIISLKLPLNKGTIRVRRRVGTEGN
jgi:cytochrome P450